MDREREYEKGKERQGASERGTNVTKERKANKQSDGGGRRDKGRREKERRSEIIAEWHRAESRVGAVCEITIRCQMLTTRAKWNPKPVFDKVGAQFVFAQTCWKSATLAG